MYKVLWYILLLNHACVRSLALVMIQEGLFRLIAGKLV
jgi:hypothetical protein